MESSGVVLSFHGELGNLSGNNGGYNFMSDKSVRKRGRPKGAVSATVSEVRQQASEERRKLKVEYSSRIDALQLALDEWKSRYESDVAHLEHELEILKKREQCYQQALGARLEEVAKHLHHTLITWGEAELEEAQVDKRKRGRPRKTLK